MNDAATKKDLALRILGHARALPAAAKFGEHKAYISAVYAVACAPEFTFVEFAALLIDLQRAGLLTLSRADLPEAMPREIVKASAVKSMGAVYHFIRLDQ